MGQTRTIFVLHFNKAVSTDRHLLKLRKKTFMLGSVRTTQKITEYEKKRSGTKNLRATFNEEGKLPLVSAHIYQKIKWQSYCRAAAGMCIFVFPKLVYRRDIICTDEWKVYVSAVSKLLCQG
jgi:hypothetical protein